MGSWSHYAESEFGLLDIAYFDSSLFRQTVAPGGYDIVQGENRTPLVIDGGNEIPWVNGQSYSRMPLFYFARYDSNGNKIGYVGFDVTITSQYTILGHRAEVILEVGACVRDLNRALVQELGGRSIGSAANDDSYAGFSLAFFLSIGVATDGHSIAVAGAGQIYNRDKDLAQQNCYFWGGILSANAAWQDIKYNESEMSPEFGKPASKKGGYNWRKTGRRPTFDDHSDTITVSSAPVLSPTSSGFFHQYYVTAADLVGFADAMFVDPTNAPDLLSAVGELCEVLYARNRMSSVLDLLIIPVTPSYGSSETITAGGRRLTYSDEQGQMRSVTGCPISNPYVDFSCGSITVPEYWANFLDFSGTKFKLFLPYVGYVDIQPEFVNGGTLWVDYRFNTIDGSFMAYVHSTSTHSELTRSLVGQYAGIAALHIPLQGNDYSQKLAGLISAAGTVAIAPAGAAAGPSLAAAAASLVNTAVAKPGTTHGNGYNASSSYLSHRKPYLIVERQIAQFSELYPHEDGLPLYVNDTIGNCKGFTRATKAHLEPIPAPAAVKARIKELLAEGIIVNQLT